MRTWRVPFILVLCLFLDLALGLMILGYFGALFVVLCGSEWLGRLAVVSISSGTDFWLGDSDTFLNWNWLASMVLKLEILSVEIFLMRASDMRLMNGLSNDQLEAVELAELAVDIFLLLFRAVGIWSSGFAVFVGWEREHEKEIVKTYEMRSAYSFRPLDIATCAIVSSSLAIELASFEGMCSSSLWVELTGPLKYEHCRVPLRLKRCKFVSKVNYPPPFPCHLWEDIPSSLMETLPHMLKDNKRRPLFFSWFSPLHGSLEQRFRSR